MNIYFNPVKLICKSTVGGIYRNQKIQFNLFNLQEDISSNNLFTDQYLLKYSASSQKNIDFLICKDGNAYERYPMEKTSYGWSIALKIHEIGLYFYCFSYENKYLIPKNNRLGRWSETSDNAFQLIVSDENYRTPDWFKGGILYQIFPDRFCREGTIPDITGRIARNDWGGIPTYQPNEKGKVLNNDFFGGNFKGIQSKLPYLKDLNVSVIYLNPIFEAASNHRYDTSDYMNVDPMLGTKQDLKNLIQKAKEQGIRIILDGVFNHTGDNSVYFNKYGTYPSIGAYQSKDSPYYSWYSFQSFPDKYSSWWGIDILPEVNEYSEDYQNFIFGDGGVLKTWLNYGIGGYRLDVADELPDFFLKKLRTAVKETDPEAIIIGEVWEDASNKIAYSQRKEYLQGLELDSVMNYPLKDAIIHFILTGKAEILSDTIKLLQDNYPKQTLDSLMNILGTHDTARILTVFGQRKCYTKEEMASPEMLLTEKEKRIAIEKLKMAALLQYTLPGVPCIYYGDESGMEGYIDPFCRKCFDWEHLNNPLLEYYTKLGTLRRQFQNIFSDGIYQEIFIENGCLVFKRKKESAEVYVYINNTSEYYCIQANTTCFTEHLQNNQYNHILPINPYSFGLFTKL